MDDTSTSMSIDDARLEHLATDVGDELKRKGWVLTVAESCTGGWVAKTITDVAGSSAWFDRGYVTYSNAAKQDLLGVSHATLERHGAVSEETVRAMAGGALTRSGADVALAVSGVAGPDGGTDAKPVGLVWFAWALRTGFVISRAERFPGDRDAVRRAAVVTVLDGVLRQVGH